MDCIEHLEAILRNRDLKNLFRGYFSMPVDSFLLLVKFKLN